MNYIDVYRDRRLLLHKRKRAENTVILYVSRLKKLEEFLMSRYDVSFDKDRIHDVKGYMLEDYDISTMSELSLATQILYLKVIKGFFRYLHEAGYIGGDPSSVLVIPESKKDEEREAASEKGYSLEEIARLMDAAKGRVRLRDRAAIAMALGTTKRTSELCSLTVGHVRNYPQERIFVRVKGGKVEEVEIAEWALPYVSEYLSTREDADDSDPLFVTMQGTPMDRHTFYKSLSRLAILAGMPDNKRKGAHQFRHTGLTAIKKTTGDIRLAQAVAGHASPYITQGYVHEGRDTKRGALTNNELGTVMRGT